MAIEDIGNTKASIADIGSMPGPGEVIIVKEDQQRASLVIEDLRLEENFSDKLMELYSRMRLRFTFAVDAATGYIHAFTVGKGSDPYKATKLIELVMRDRRGWIETLNYPWPVQCTPKLWRVPEGLGGFANDEVRTILEEVNCKLELIRDPSRGRNKKDRPLEVLNDLVEIGQTYNRGRLAGLKVYFNEDFMEGAFGDPLVRYLQAFMNEAVSAYNYYTRAANGRTLRHNMVTSKLPPAPDKHTMRLLFGWRTRRELDEDCKTQVFRIPYRASLHTAWHIGKHRPTGWVAVDLEDLSAISVEMEGGLWCEIENEYDLPEGYRFVEWQHSMREVCRNPRLNLFKIDDKLPGLPDAGQLRFDDLPMPENDEAFELPPEDIAAEDTDETTKPLEIEGWERLSTLPSQENRLVSLAPTIGEPADLSGTVVTIEERRVDILDFLEQCGLSNLMSEQSKLSMSFDERATILIAVDSSTGCIVGMKAARTHLDEAALMVASQSMRDKTELSMRIGSRWPWVDAVRPTAFGVSGDSSFLNQPLLDGLGFLGVGISTTSTPTTCIENMVKIIRANAKSVRVVNGPFKTMVEEFEAILTVAVCDAHNAVLTGAAIQGRRPPVSADDLPSSQALRLAFGLEQHARVVGPDTVELSGVEYKSQYLPALLGSLESRTRRVKYDPIDFSTVSVWHSDHWWIDALNTVDAPAKTTKAELEELLAEQSASAFL